MKRQHWAFLAGLVAIIAAVVLTPPPSPWPSPVYAQQIAQDPCFSSQITKSSAPIAITTATTTNILPVAAPFGYFVCGFSITSSSTTTANTVLFEYGTGASCTGTHALTGALNNGIGTAQHSYGTGGATVFSVPQNNGLCIVSTVGSTPFIEGILTYVKQ